MRTTKLVPVHQRKAMKMKDERLKMKDEKLKMKD
jgi:hypothetical protein